MVNSKMAPSLGAIAAVLLLPAAAGAEGFYLYGGAGLNIPRDSDVDSATFNLEAEHDLGMAGAGAFGYGFDSGLRLEAELGYRTGDLDSISGASASGDVDVWSGMANVLYDFKLDSPITPFIGAGVGVARVDVDGASPVSTTTIDDHDTALAYQGIAGVAYRISERIDLSLSYRYFAVPDLGFTASNGASVDSEYAAHTVLVGLRFTFGAPPRPPQPQPAAAPPPEPAPPPQPQAAQRPAPQPSPPLPNNFLVFFDWDSAELTPQARSIISTAAENAKRTGTARITATGHADRSGPRTYNQRLSQRRAETLKGELVRLGIPASSIVVVARGEEQPLVPTADGVREPQNRRVEIVLE